MKFRPCIDIHNGKVKQIVGGSLRDSEDQAVENFTSLQDAAYYARMYQEDGLKGGHMILLNPPASEYYEQTKAQAFAALVAYPGGMHIGGGITVENACEYLKLGASHIIVTSYVFQDGEIRWDRMKQLRDTVGKARIVIDLSCRKKGKDYYIVTNRWQTFTEVALSHELLDTMAEFCDEYLVHGVDVEGSAGGIEPDLVKLLGTWDQIPITYAGGIGSLADIEQFRAVSAGNLDFTIGSALDIFGGSLAYDMVKRIV